MGEELWLSHEHDYMKLLACWSYAIAERWLQLCSWAATKFYSKAVGGLPNSALGKPVHRLFASSQNYLKIRVCMVTVKDKLSYAAHCLQVSLRPEEQQTEKGLETTLKKKGTRNYFKKIKTKVFGV